MSVRMRMNPLGIPKYWGARRGGDNTRRKTTQLSSACQRPQNRSPRALGRKVQPPHDQGSSGFEFDSSECPAWVARFRPTLRRRESSALGRKVSSGEVPWANERRASRRLRRGPANGRLPSGNVPPTLRRRHPPCTLTRSPSSARPPRGASVCNGTGSNYGAAIYPYRYRYPSPTRGRHSIGPALHAAPSTNHHHNLMPTPMCRCTVQVHVK